MEGIILEQDSAKTEQENRIKDERNNLALQS